MKNFKRKLIIFIVIFFLAVIVGAVGGGLLTFSLKQEPHNTPLIMTSGIMLSLGISIVLASAGMLYSIIYQNNEVKKEAIKITHEEEILPYAKAYLKGKYGYDDTNSKIFCKDGKVYCRPITDVKEITVDITIE